MEQELPTLEDTTNGAGTAYSWRPRF
jgi:hypothetical protein